MGEWNYAQTPVRKNIQNLPHKFKKQKCNYTDPNITFCFVVSVTGYLESKTLDHFT